VDVTGGALLELRVTDGGDGNGGDHADWAAARLACAG
jgi:beta-galactosidase